MNAHKPVPVVEDAAVAVFDGARPPDELLTAEEVEAIERRISHGGPGISSEELLARLRPTP